MDAAIARRRQKPVIGLGVAIKKGRGFRLDFLFCGNKLFNPADFGPHSYNIRLQVLDIPTLHVSRHDRWFQLFEFVIHHTPYHIPHAFSPFTAIIVQ